MTRGQAALCRCQPTSLVPELSLSTQPLVQLTQLLQEAVVGPNFSFLTNRGQSSVDIHVLAEHQIGYDQRRWAAVAFPAMNVNFTCRKCIHEIWVRFLEVVTTTTESIQQWGKTKPVSISHKKSGTFSSFVHEGLLDEVCRLLEVNTDVKVVRVAGRYAMVNNACAGVELGPRVDMHEWVTLGGVQDVGDALPLQTHHIHCPKPAPEWHEKHVLL